MNTDKILFGCAVALAIAGFFAFARSPKLATACFVAAWVLLFILKRRNKRGNP